jgi:hypothetical protein
MGGLPYDDPDSGLTDVLMVEINAKVGTVVVSCFYPTGKKESYASLCETIIGSAKYVDA